MLDAMRFIQAAARSIPLDEAAPTFRDFSKTLMIQGKRPGQYVRLNIDSDPVQSWLGDQIDSGRWERIFYCASPQVTGKTTICIIATALWQAIGCGANVGYAMPTLQDLDKQWQDKLKPGIIAGGYERSLPAKGPGARGGRAPSIQLLDRNTGIAKGRVIFLAGGGYGSTVRAVLIDEIDQFRTSSGTPLWEDIEDIWARADHFGDLALRIGVGTIETNSKDDCIILTLTDSHGTGTRVHIPCPSCGEWQAPDSSQFVYAFEATSEREVRESARIACKYCGDCTKWDENERQKSLRSPLFVHGCQGVQDGVIIGPEPETRSLGLVQNSYVAVRADLRTMAVKHWEAQRNIDQNGSHGLMSTWYRYGMCELYTGDRQEEGAATALTPKYLAARGNNCNAMTWIPEKTGTYSRYIADRMPPDVHDGVISCDVQGNRVYWWIGGTDGRATYDLGCGYEHLPKIGVKLAYFGKGDLNKILDRIAGEVRDLFALRYRAGVVDTGFDENDDLAEWLKANRSEFFGIRGAPSIPDKYKKRIKGLLAWDSRWRPGLGRYWIASKVGIAKIHAAYLARPTAHGAAIPPSNMSANLAFFQHMCSWGQNEKDGWVKKKDAGRDDFLDCRSYGTTVLEYLISKDGDAVNAGEQVRPPIPQAPAPNWITDV